VSRVQLALNVSDIDAAVAFYSKLFGAKPAKRQPGYANFAIAEPPLKLVLIENTSARGTGVAGALNHLGVEVETPEEVREATHRLASEGLVPEVQESTTCCYAVQDKAWVNDPDETGLAGDGTCCASADELVSIGNKASSACC
jgi:catechol 2,3-dioxygenase-like lactoylglutathione lyase family enzyme